MADSKRKVVSDVSGLCSGGAAHRLCRGEWDTPSAQVRCRCECHATKEIVAKSMAKKIVAKR